MIAVKTRDARFRDQSRRLYLVPGDRYGRAQLARGLRRTFGPPRVTEGSDFKIRARFSTRGEFGQHLIVATVDSGWAIPYVVLFRIGKTTITDGSLPDQWLRRSVDKPRMLRAFWGRQEAVDFLLGPGAEGVWVVWAGSLLEMIDASL